jgi:hypothetical protein
MTKKLPAKYNQKQAAEFKLVVQTLPDSVGAKEGA